MRNIKKGVEPKSLMAYRATKNPTFANLPTQAKKDIKNQLLDEQGHTCAYCMQQIKFDTMRVEHWLPQHANPHKNSTLNYKNLLGCCDGNARDGNTNSEHTCDVKKANDIIKYSPANPSHAINSKINYLSSGLISSSDEDFKSQLNNILNLNIQMIVDNRTAALDNIKYRLNSLSGATRTKVEINKLLTWATKKNKKNKHIVFYGAVINYLEKRLKRA